MSYIWGVRDTFLYPPAAALRPGRHSAAVFDKDRNPLYSYSTLRSGYLSGLVSIFYGLGYLDKRYKVWYTAKLSAGGTLRGIVMSFSKMGGDLKKDHNTYNPSIRYIRFEVWGYEVWDRNGLDRNKILWFGMSDLCRYTRGAFLDIFIRLFKHLF